MKNIKKIIYIGLALLCLNVFSQNELNEKMINEAQRNVSKAVAHSLSGFPIDISKKLLPCVGAAFKDYAKELTRLVDKQSGRTIELQEAMKFVQKSLLTRDSKIQESCFKDIDKDRKEELILLYSKNVATLHPVTLAVPKDGAVISREKATEIEKNIKTPKKEIKKKKKWWQN